MSWTTSPLIGRADELRLIEEALQRARMGRSVLLEVAAEAGYGKSRLVAESVRRLPADRVLLVACFEDDHRPFSLIRRLGISLAAAVAHPRIDWDALLADSPFAAGERVASLLDRFAAKELGVVVLEDLHWADSLSLEALIPLGSHFGSWGSSARPCHLALFGTYRPFEMRDQAAAVLSRLSQHVDDVVHATPRPLTPLEVNALVLGLGFGRPSGRLLSALVETTVGNPLHVQTVMSRLDGADRLRRDGGMVDFLGALLPADLGHDLIGAIDIRLKVLADDDCDLLGLAALLDPPVELRRLAEAAGLEVEELVDRLRPMEDEGLVQVDDPIIWFRHPLLRSVLARRLRPTRRSQYELHIAELLLSAEDEQGLVAAARHLSRVRNDGPAEVAASTCEQAAHHAAAAGDYALAADLAESALFAHSRLGSAASLAAGRLHQLAAFAQFRNHDKVAWRTHVDAGRAIAVAIEDDALLCDVELVATRAEMTFGPHPVDASRIDALLQAPHRLDRARIGRLCEVAAEVRFGAGAYEDGAALAGEAIEKAQRTGDSDDETMAQFAAGLNAWGRLQLGPARDHFETCERLSRGASDRWLATWGLGRLLLVRRMEGRFEDVLAGAAENIDRATVLGDWSELALASALTVSVFSAYGDRELALAGARQALQYGARGDYVWAPTILLPTLAGLHAERGEDEEAERLLDQYSVTGAPAPRPFRQLVATCRYDREALRTQFVPRRLRAPMTAMTLVGYCAFGAAAVELGDTSSAAQAVDDLRGVAEAGVLVPIGWNLLLPRVFGAVLRVAGQHTESMVWLERAAERATLCGAFPELARTFLELARLHADGFGSRDLGREHVARAVAIGRRLGMAPLVAEASTLGLSLGRFDGDAEVLAGLEDQGSLGPLLGAVLFTDIVDSTRLNRQARDAAWVKVLAEHDRRIRACLDRFGGVEFAHTGDGIGAYFASAERAVACAAAVHGSLRSIDAARGEGLAVRIGICWGEATPRGRDLAGSMISRCVRVMSFGDGGDTTVDEAIACATRGTHGFRALGSRHLKGFDDEPHALFRLEPPT